jgi:transposase
MRKLHIEDAAVTRIAIQHEIGRTEESRYGHRLHGLLLLAAGHSCQQVAALFGEDDTTVQRWVKRFMQGGLTALREGQRTGRPPTLAPQQWSRLEADLRSDPRDFGFAAVCWDGPTLSKLLRLRYGVELGVRQCQRIFQQIRFGQRGTEYRATDSAPPHHSEMTAGMSIGTAD